MIDDDDDTLDAPDESEDTPTLEAWAMRALRSHARARTSLEVIAEAYSEDTGEPPPSPVEVLEALAHLYPAVYDEHTGGYALHATLIHTY